MIVTSNLKMTQTALKTVASLLVLVSIIQGFQDLQVFHHKTMDVLVGQNTSLPCTVQDVSNNIIVSTEWNKKDHKSSKLALYTPTYGYQYFSPNVTLKPIYNDTKTFLGTYLELYNIDKGHAGTYICEITGFPTGSHKRETQLRIKDKIECDMNSTIKVSSGENVTIRCSEINDAEYTWTKDEVAVSDSPSLHLLSVTDANAGLYKLTVNAGSSHLQAEFTITVRTQTTGLWADVTTMSAHSSSSESETTSHSPVTVSADYTDYTQNTVTAIPISHSQPDHFQNTSDSATYHTNQGFNQSETFTATLSYNTNEAIKTSTAFIEQTNTEYTSVISETDSKINATELPGDSLSKSIKTTSPGTIRINPDATLTSRPGSTDTTDVTVQQDPANSGGQSHLVLVLVIVGGVLLTIVVLVLYRRRMIKKRMDLPPPFKPPPPPLKYTAVRNPQQHFPTDRCNSIPMEAMEIKHSINRLNV